MSPTKLIIFSKKTCLVFLLLLLLFFFFIVVIHIHMNKNKDIYDAESGLVATE